MSAVAEITTGTVKATIDIDASPERVFGALTDPSELAAWWGADDVYRTFDWHVDLRPGGGWNCQARNAQGQLTSVRGRYVTIDPPRLLEYTWQPSWEDFAETRIRIELEATSSGTRLTMTHSGFGENQKSCEDHASGWNAVLGWLTAHFGDHR